MRQIHKQDCPLCSSPAKYQLVDHDNRKHFHCPHCTDFQISIDAEKVLATSIQQWRTQFSEVARRGNEEKALVILLPSAPYQEGVANPAFDSALVLRANLPR